MTNKDELVKLVVCKIYGWTLTKEETVKETINILGEADWLNYKGNMAVGPGKVIVFKSPAERIGNDIHTIAKACGQWVTKIGYNEHGGIDYVELEGR